MRSEIQTSRHWWAISFLKTQVKAGAHIYANFKPHGKCRTLNKTQKQEREKLKQHIEDLKYTIETLENL